MTDRMPAPSDEELSAFIDGELDKNHREKIELALARDANLAARVSDLRINDEYMRRMAEPILKEPVPEHLRNLIRGSVSSPQAPKQPASDWRRRLELFWQFSALAATLLIGVGLGWYAKLVSSDEDSLLAPYVQQAVLSHRLFEADKQFDPVETDSDVISIDAALKPFSGPARTPALLGSDYIPVMVRKVEGERGDAIHIAYEGKNGSWTTLYIRQQSNDGRLPAKFVHKEGQSVLYWLDGPLLYALVGNGDEEQMRELAEKIYASKATSEAQPLQPEQPMAPAVAR